jgi:ATP-dependent RNA helicase RhlE
MSFSNLGLTPALGTTLARLGYTTPTPVQDQAIPIVLTGADLVARAQTGTGKTAAFGLPIIQRLLNTPRPGSGRGPRVLILVPTRELALQVRGSLASYAAGSRIRVAAIFGGVGMGGQLRELRNGLDIVVATPGRLLDHMTQRSIDLSKVEVLTLDEADRMLDMGFQPALKRIVPALPATRQTLLFSATLSEEILGLCAALTRDAARVDVSEGHMVAATVTHHVHAVATGQKRAMLTHLLRRAGGDQALVFCKTKRGSDRVGEHLEREGIKMAVIHGNKSQGARTRALAAFKAGRVNVLVATDIAARGLDIAQLPLVVNYELPLVPEDYIHRVGRTGRAGRDGHAVSLVSSDEASLLRDIQRLLPAPIVQVDVSGFAPVTLERMVPAQPSSRGRNAGPSRGGFQRPAKDPQRRRAAGRARHAQTRPPRRRRA